MRNMDVNEAIKNLQFSQREDTVSKVKEAIQYIRDFEGENARLTANKILKNCDVSRAVLYKRHILELWNPRLWYHRYGRKQGGVDPYYDKELKKLQAEKEQIYQKFKVSEGRNQQLTEQLQKQKQISQGYLARNKELDEENSVLLGKLSQYQTMMHSRGIQF
ncbi:hypothetical protein J4772_06385 [Cohnella sp. LGH]|uniref:hypothetical protein n=1 Tax=Cohnella sp. LGH TaxID=1619153 RepID=UPI001ADCA076|nr:hypothetical protein [Cohnella sp. LGH]QTH44029.1 hypothetical protein J4772_06385 [Cohnella sp. LGH]